MPQGGNTGLVGGQIPYETGNEIVLSLDRMNRDPQGRCGRQQHDRRGGRHAQDRAGRGREGEPLFPAEPRVRKARCRIGGNLSTNAGGLAVLAYGKARDLCLGLEVVLADGRIWNGLKSLRKDNTGYDLKSIFLGAEGTLGVITAAVVKLFARPAATRHGLRRPALASGRDRSPFAGARDERQPRDGDRALPAQWS